MSDDTNQNPLGITEGLATLGQGFIGDTAMHDVWLTGTTYRVKFQSDADAALYADAHNTTQRTGKLPSELEADINHAIAEAKKYVPDYPWQIGDVTASVAVWATGTSYRGASSACDDWAKRCESIEKELADLKRQRDELRDVLIEMRDAVKEVPAMNHMKYDALGSRANKVLANTKDTQ